MTQTRRRNPKNAVGSLALGALLLVPGFVFAAIPATERTALTALYTSTNGAGWTTRTNWRNAGNTDFNIAGTECTWFGVTCDAGQTHVTRIVLQGNNLTGTLPAQLGQLPNLILLDLGRVWVSSAWVANSIGGAIPPELGSLSNLQSLYLTQNVLTGSIPPELGSLASLQALDQPAGGLDPPRAWESHEPHGPVFG